MECECRLGRRGSLRDQCERVQRECGGRLAALYSPHPLYHSVIIIITPLFSLQFQSERGSQDKLGNFSVFSLDLLSRFVDTVVLSAFSPADGSNSYALGL